jgi:major membrane immunogen (membrane-anchored lipoprotein)
MKKNNISKGILITAIIAVLAVILTAGILLLNQNNATKVTSNNSPGAIDLTGYPNTGDVIIRSASYLYTEDGKIDGYLVSVASKGYNGMIQMDITFDNTGNIVKSVVIKDHKESEDYGDKITAHAFLDQFSGITAPLVLSGENTPDTEDSTDINGEDTSIEEQTSDTQSEELSSGNTDSTDSQSTGTVWADGTYETEEADFDEQGYKDKVSLTIQDGRITEVIWDAYNEAGELKSVLSADGIYEMPGDLTWQEQAMAITDFLIQNQSAEAITLNAEGKTDAVTGVSISVKDFVTLVKEGLQKAAADSAATGTDNEPGDSQTGNTADTSNAADTVETAPSSPDSENTTENPSGTIDAVSGATVSSSAVVAAVNKAQAFIQDFVMTK